jgi:predicted DNA-binding protein YlxM (UPF0122 family)
MPDKETYDFLNGKPSITYIVTFGNKDKDIWQWAASIPKGRFSLVIKDMLRAYYNQDDNYILPIYNTGIEVKKPFRKSFGIGKLDYDVYEIISRFEDQLISFQVKQVIRHYISKDNRLSYISPTNMIKNNAISDSMNEKTNIDNDEEQLNARKIVMASESKDEGIGDRESVIKTLKADNHSNNNTGSINQKSSVEHLLGLADKAKFKK